MAVYITKIYLLITEVFENAKKNGYPDAKSFGRIIFSVNS